MQHSIVQRCVDDAAPSGANIDSSDPITIATASKRTAKPIALNLSCFVARAFTLLTVN
jgi:hypothetical protein